MSFIPSLPKLSRYIRKKILRMFGKRLWQKKSGVAGIRLVSIDAKSMSVELIPAVDSVAIKVQLAKNDGIVIAEWMFDRQVEIRAGQTLEVRLPLVSQILSKGDGEYLLKLVQGRRQAGERLMFRVDPTGLRRLHPSIEDFLAGHKRKLRSLDIYLPHGPGEKNSMEHLSNADFVQYLYHWLLGRDPDPRGFNSHFQELNNCVPREILILGMLNSEESANFRRFASLGASGMDSYPFSEAHDRLRIALGAVGKGRG